MGTNKETKSDCMGTLNRLSSTVKETKNSSNDYLGFYVGSTEQVKLWECSPVTHLVWKKQN